MFAVFSNIFHGPAAAAHTVTRAAHYHQDNGTISGSGHPRRRFSCDTNNGSGRKPDGGTIHGRKPDTSRSPSHVHGYKRQRKPDTIAPTTSPPRRHKRHTAHHHQDTHTPGTIHNPTHPRQHHNGGYISPVWPYNALYGLVMLYHALRCNPGPVHLVRPFVAPGRHNGGGPCVLTVDR